MRSLRTLYALMYLGFRSMTSNRLWFINVLVNYGGSMAILLLLPLFLGYSLGAEVTMRSLGDTLLLSIAWSIMFSGSRSLLKTIPRLRTSRALEEFVMAYPHISVILIGETLINQVFTILVLGPTLIFVSFLLGLFNPSILPLYLLLLIDTMAIDISTGLILASLAWRHELGGTVDAFMILATYLCGFLVPPEVFPKPLAYISFLLPWTYSSQAVRKLLGGELAYVYSSLLYLPLLAIILGVAGHLLIEKQFKHSRVRGDLSIYMR